MTNHAEEYADGIINDMSSAEIIKQALNLGIIQTQLLDEVTEALRAFYIRDFYDLENQYADSMEEC